MGQAIFEVVGGRELRTTMRKAGVDLGDLKDAHANVAAQVATRARGAAPFRTGALAGSVRGSGTKTQAIVRAGGARVRYANVIHWGWPGHHIKAQPWITEAAQDQQEQWTATYEAAVQRILDQVKGA